MISQFGRNLIWFFLGEIFVLVASWLLKDDKRKMAMVFVGGTLVSGIIGFGPQVMLFIQRGFASLPEISFATPPPVATSKPVLDFQTLSLQAQSELSSPETNLGLPSGTNYLLEIPFANGWKATTQCNIMPDRPTSITIDTDISNPLEVYVLFQAGWGITPYNGLQVGVINLYFQEVKHEEILILGYNIRDWSRNKRDAISTVSSPMVTEAWRGTLPDGVIGGMDILSIPIPSSYQQSTLTRFELLDTTLTTTGNMNPCVHLLAVTVKFQK